MAIRDRGWDHGEDGVEVGSVDGGVDVGEDGVAVCCVDGSVVW